MFCDNYILTEVELFGSFYLNFQFTPLYGLNLFILLLLISIIINYIFGLAIFKTSKKLYLVLGLICNVIYLLAFKVPSFNLILPLGISFYSFKSISFLVDVYKNKASKEPEFLETFLYITFFPQLISGPISKYSYMENQLSERKTDLNCWVNGLKKFIIGLSFKVLLANQIAKLWNEVTTIGFDSISSPLAWLGAIGFSFQIYFDFYGYSLMAIGLAEIFGFKTLKNFDTPYFSTSMTEFWRKWHISLGLWFKEYLYIPLGGNRKGPFITAINLFIVWLITGMWHGGSLNYLLWGISLFIIIILEKTFLKKILDKFKFLGHIYMIFLIPLTWMLFAITKIQDIPIYFSRLFFIETAENVYSLDYIKYGKSYGILLLICLLFSTPIIKKIYIKFENKLIMNIFLVGIFWLSIYFVFLGLNDPFLYFKF